MKITEIYGTPMVEFLQTKNIPYVTVGDKIYVSIYDYCTIKSCPHIKKARLIDWEYKDAEEGYKKIPLDHPYLELDLYQTRLSSEDYKNLCMAFNDSIEIAADETYDEDGISGVCLVVKITL